MQKLRASQVSVWCASLIILLMAMPALFASSQVVGTVLSGDAPKLLLDIQGTGFIIDGRFRMRPVNLRLVYLSENETGVPEIKRFTLLWGIVRIEQLPPTTLKEGYAILNLAEHTAKLFAETKSRSDFGGITLSLTGKFATSGRTLKMNLNGTLRSGSIVYSLHVFAIGTLRSVRDAKP